MPNHLAWLLAVAAGLAAGGLGLARLRRTGRYDLAGGGGARLVRLPHGLTRCEVRGPAGGRPVLIIPGMTYPMEVFDALVAALAGRGYRTIRYDLHGRGGSEYDGAVLDVDALAGQARALLDELGVREAVHAVTLSNSDLLVSALAARHPGRVGSIAWIAPSGLDRRTMNRHVRLLASVPIVRELWGPLLRRTCARRMRGHRARLPASAPPAAHAFYAGAIAAVSGSPVFPAALVSHMGHLPRDEEVIATLEGLRRASIPVLMLRFGAEADATDEGLAPLKERLPAAREEWIAEGTHMGLVERPDEVSASVLAFLDGLA